MYVARLRLVAFVRSFVTGHTHWFHTACNLLCFKWSECCSRQSIKACSINRDLQNTRSASWCEISRTFMATLVKADTIHNVTGTAGDLLKQYPESPYTAFVVTTQDQIECYAQHCARLSEGLCALQAVDSTSNCRAPDVGGMQHDPCVQRYTGV